MSLFQTDTDLTIIDVHTDSNPQRQLPPIRSGQLIIVDNGDVYFDNYQNKRVKINSSSSSGGASLSGLTECELGLLMYGDASIVPSPESWFVVDEGNPSNIKALSAEAKGATEIVFPYKIGDTYIRTIDTGGYVDVMAVNLEGDVNSLTCVYLPSTLTRVGNNAFGAFPRIEEVHTGNKNLTIAHDAFNSVIKWLNGGNTNMWYEGRISVKLLQSSFIPATPDMVGCMFEITNEGDLTCDSTVDFEEEYSGYITVEAIEDSTAYQVRLPNDYSGLYELLCNSSEVTVYTADKVMAARGTINFEQSSPSTWVFNDDPEVRLPSGTRGTYIQFKDYTVHVNAGDTVVWTGLYWKVIGTGVVSKSGATALPNVVTVGTSSSTASDYICDESSSDINSPQAAHTVINDAIKSLANSGGTVKLLSGVYIIKGEVNIDKHNVKLCGEGSVSLFLQGGNIKITAPNCEICDLSIQQEPYGSATHVEDNGIHIIGKSATAPCARARIHRLRMLRSTIYLDYAENCVIQDNIMGKDLSLCSDEVSGDSTSGDVCGIYSENGSGNLITNNILTGYHYCVLLDNESFSVISNNISTMFTQIGIRLQWCKHVNIEGNNIKTSMGGSILKGIQVASCSNVTIANNQVIFDDPLGRYIGITPSSYSSSCACMVLNNRSKSNVDPIVENEYIFISNTQLSYNGPKAVPCVYIEDAAQGIQLNYCQLFNTKERYFIIDSNENGTGKCVENGVVKVDLSKDTTSI